MNYWNLNPVAMPGMGDVCFDMDDDELDGVRFVVEDVASLSGRSETALREGDLGKVINLLREIKDLLEGL